MMLDCRLTDDELLSRGEYLSTLVQEKESLELQKKEVATDYKTRIDDKTSRANEIAKIIKQGFEERAVEVTEQSDYTARTIAIIRIDTGEVVNTRSMAIEDSQEEMSFDEDRHEGKITMLGVSRQN